jgi:hypothetical protein
MNDESEKKTELPAAEPVAPLPPLTPPGTLAARAGEPGEFELDTIYSSKVAG